MAREYRPGMPEVALRCPWHMASCASHERAERTASCRRSLAARMCRTHRRAREYVSDVGQWIAAGSAARAPASSGRSDAARAEHRTLVARSTRLRAGDTPAHPQRPLRELDVSTCSSRRGLCLGALCGTRHARPACDSWRPTIDCSPVSSSARRRFLPFPQILTSGSSTCGVDWDSHNTRWPVGSEPPARRSCINGSPGSVFHRRCSGRRSRHWRRPRLGVDSP